MSEITPITREEKLWNGEDLEPLTREEMYIKRIFDKTQTIPDKPLTRKEILMEKAGEGGGGDVTIKQLSVTANGTYSEEGTAYSPVVVNVPTPENAYLLKEASGSLVSFSDGADLPMPSFICNIDAVQDLHGQDGPWVGGAGKNKLPMTVDGIKAVNTSGTWSGNAYTANGVTFKIQTDYDSNVIGIIVDTNGGIASADVIFYLSADGNRGFNLLQGASYIVTADGATNNVGVRIGDSTDAYVGMVKPNPLTFTADSSNTARIGVNNGLSISNVTIKPMIRLSTETDPTFAPYSNICPISGHTGVNAVISPTTEASAGTTYSVSWQTEAGEVFGGYVDLVSGVLVVTHKSQTSFTRGSQDSSNKLYNIGTISDIKAYTNASAISPYFVDSMFEKLSVQGARTAETPSITHYNKALYVGGYIGKEAELDTLLETLQVKYELETPITYQLTPTQIKSLLGKNNAWCSTGDVDIDYFAKEV